MRLYEITSPVGCNSAIYYDIIDSEYLNKFHLLETIYNIKYPF